MLYINRLWILRAALLIWIIACMNSAVSFAATATLSWAPPSTYTDGTPVTGLAGYKLHYGPASMNYTTSIVVGNVTTYEVSNLLEGTTYYFSVTAFDSAGNESTFSNEISKTISTTSTSAFTITAGASTAGGTISPSGTTMVNFGSSQTFTIKPVTGYHIASVVIDGVSIGRVSTYTFSNITANHTIAANFAINTYTITAGASTTGGTISPPGKTKVPYGGSAVFTIAPDAGYHVADVLADSKSIGPVTSYTFSNVKTGHTITASFAINTYNLAASAGAGGTISPPGTTTVNFASSQTFTIKPITGYHIASVVIDGVSIGRVPTYTFSNITANHSIAANFAINTYTITAGASTTGGTISPPGKVKVSYGGSAVFTITPDAGYHVADVLIDSKSVGPVTSYTFSNVKTGHTITASFALN